MSIKGGWSMRATIVVDDNIVLVGGVAQKVDCSPLIAQNIHAVQWYDTVGEEEFRADPETGARAPNNKIADFSPYQPYVDLWNAKAAKAKINPALNTMKAKTTAQILGV
jgi:hypothetical protein